MKPNKKTLVTALTFLLIGIIGTSIVWVFAQPSNVFTLSEGIYPSATTITFGRDGSTYYGKTAYGVRVYPSSNATNTINSATNAYDGAFFLSDAVYNLDTSILVDSGDSLIGHSPNAILNLTAGITAIMGRGNALRYIYLKDFSIDGNMISGTNGINFSDPSDSIEASTISGVQFHDIEGTNIYLKEAYQIDIYNIHLGWNTGTYISEIGIELEGCGGINIYGNGIYACNNLIVLDGGYQAQVTGNSFYYFNNSVISVAPNSFSQLKFIGNKIRGAFNGSGDPATNAYHAIDVYEGRLHYSVISGNTFRLIRREVIRAQRMQTVTISDNTFWDSAYETNNTYSIIWLNGSSEVYNTVYNNIHDNVFYTSPSFGEIKSAIEMVGNSSWTGYTTIHDNTFAGAYGGSPIITIGSENLVHHNRGFVTENMGAILVTTLDYIEHGLSGTPTTVVLTPRLSGITYGVTSRNGTHFQITHDSGSNDWFDWRAIYEP